MYTIVETFKDKKCLTCDGYCYLCDRMRNVNNYWRREKRTECPGRLVEQAGQNPVVTIPHNYEPNEAKNQ